MKKDKAMLLGLVLGALVGGLVGAIAGAFTEGDLATTQGFFYRGVPAIFIVATLVIIVNKLSLHTAPLRAGIGWLLLILALLVVGGLVGLIGGFLLRASPERIVWMWIKGNWAAALGVLVAAIIAAISVQQ